jgi:chromosome segregation ATPase
LGPLRSQVEHLTKADDELKRQQFELSALMNEEQSRWTAFNARLEELEQALAPTSPRRQP